MHNGFHSPGKAKYKLQMELQNQNILAWMKSQCSDSQLLTPNIQIRSNMLILIKIIIYREAKQHYRWAGDVGVGLNTSDDFTVTPLPFSKIVEAEAVGDCLFSIQQSSTLNSSIFTTQKPLNPMAKLNWKISTPTEFF